MARLNALAVLTAILLALAVDPARAELKNTYTSMTGPQLAAILRAKGYQADLVADSGGDPLINSGTGGTHFQIWFAGCDKAPIRSCKNIEFYSAFTNDKNYAPADANRCNVKLMFGRVQILDDGIAVTYGVPIINIDDEYVDMIIAQWETLVSAYQSCMVEQRQ